MGQETMGKREREKKKRQKKQQKLEKKLERKENNNKGDSLDNMMAYIDENGNLSDTPPDPKEMKEREIAAEDIQLGAAPQQPGDSTKKGIVKFYSEEKGYGFILDKFTKESYFVHASELNEPINEQDTVTFEPSRGPKGKIATKVTKLF